MKIDAIGETKTFEDTGINKNPVDSGSDWKSASISDFPDVKPKESISEKANRSVEQMRKEFSEIQKQSDEWRNNVVRMNVAQADNSVPDDEAKINELAKQFNAPVDMVRNYRKLFEAQSRNLKLAELQKTNPKTAEFLTDPNNARIAHDDIDNLARTEDAIDSVLAYPQAFAAGIVRDFLGNRIKGATERILASNYTTRMMQDVYAGAIGLSDDRLASEWGEIDAGEYKTMRDIIMTPAKAVIAAGNRIDVPDKQKTFGVQVAAGLGQVAGQIASAFVDPAGQLSALIDQGIGAVSDDVQKDIEAAREAGVDVDFSRRLAAILGGGAATGVTEKLSLELIGSPLASRIANRAARFAVRTLVGGLSEGSQEVAESALQTYIRQQLTNPGAKYQTGAEMFEEFTVAGAVGAIVANMLGLRRFRIGQATEKGIKSLNDEAKASKLRGRDKQVYETLVSTQTEGTPLENAYINTEAWRTYFQSQGLDPKEQAERYGVTNYDEAVATGSDLSIPFPAYQADFSASDHAPNFVRDTKLSENGMTVNEREAYMQRIEERAKETEDLLERIGKESENARAVNDVLSRLTDEIAIQLEPTFDKQTARTQATIMARAFLNPVQRDVIERAREQGEELTADEIAGRIRDAFDRYGLTINPSATPTTLNTRKDVDPAIDSMLEKLRKNEIPKERDVYGQSLMEYIRKKGGIKPDDVLRDLVKNKQLPRSILNEKGMGADELAALQDVLDFGIETESIQADNALLDALVNEYTTGEKRYSNAQLNAGLLAELQSLDNLSRDLAAAGIDLNQDNATIRKALSAYYEEQQNGKDTGKESQTSETYEQRGFTESAEPTAEERAEANRQYDEVEQKYRDTDQWMKAPNGEPTKLTERQWIQVRTPNFKNWFGDWENDPENASKVVDENGEPMVVYHGTTTNVGEDFAFNYKKIGTTGSAQGYGFYFTSERETAEGYSGSKGGSLIQAYLNMRKPMPLNQKKFSKSVMKKIIKNVISLEMSEYQDEIESWRDGFLSNYTDTYSSSLDSAINETIDIINDSSDNALEQISEIANVSGSKKIALASTYNATGFDGVLAKGYGDNEKFFISWFPESVKSVSNIGTFSESANILYQKDNRRGFTESERPTQSEIEEANNQYDNVYEKYIGTSSWMKAPNGEHTKLTERQWVQVRTPNFKKWFGDWENDPENASKVVDENGEPRVVYHGTDAGSEREVITKRRPIQYFDKSREIQKQFQEKMNELEGGRSWNELSNDANYFSEREKIIKWRDGQISKLDNDYPEIETKEIIKNKPILVFDKKMLGKNTSGNAANIGLEGSAYLGFWFNYGGNIPGSNIMPIFLKISKPYDAGNLENISGEIESTRKKTAKSSANAYLNPIKKKGFDGLFLNDTEFGGTSYVAFEPEQIKSAIGNIGTFSESPNILYQFIGEKGAAALDRAREATVRLDNLAIAREMESAGKYAKEIKFATGWERGADGKWRYEIDDGSVDIEVYQKRLLEEEKKKDRNFLELNDAIALRYMKDSGKSMPEAVEEFKRKKGRSPLPGAIDAARRNTMESLENLEQDLRRSARKRSESVELMLWEVIDNPALYNAYPELKNIHVTIKKFGGGFLGVYLPDEKRIMLNENAPDKERTLLHEVQHAIQDIEGFAKGGNVQSMDNFYSKTDVYADFERLYDLYRRPEWKDKVRKEAAVNRAKTPKTIEKRRSELEDALDTLKKTGLQQEIDAAIARVKRRYRKGSADLLVDILIKEPYNKESTMFTNMVSLLNETGNIGFDKYYRLAGETEARNVSKRLSMNIEERRASLAEETEDVLREDQIFLYQSLGAGKIRGATVINPDRTMRIELFKDANYSTFVHETAHFMLEVYGDLASDAQASAYIRNEYATIRQYLGAEEGKPITREQHEKFARSFEAYLMEGKAPSPELQGIFSRFKNWLLNIYRSMRSLNVSLNNDIRDVFDRMLASDEEIAIMREASELQPLFATAEKMGIAQDEFDAYRNIAEKELIDAQDRFRQKAMKAKLLEKRKGYKEEFEAEKKRVEKEYDRDPVVAAFNDLTADDGISLNEEELRRIYGNAFLAKLPRKNGKRIYSKDGNVSLEELAEGLGFNSGDELIRAIAQLPDRKTYIEDKARQNIIDREGDVLNSDNIADEAENALHNEYMEQRLKKELAILNRLKRAGKAAKLSEQRKRIEQRKEAKRIEDDVNAQVESMEVAARSVIAEKPVKELKPNLYLRAMQKASRKARQELNRTEPDYTAAARQKQAEIMNNILYREAKRVQKELNRRTLQAKAVVRKPLKDAVKTRDSLFVNRAKYIAAKLGLGGNADIIMQRIVTEEKNRQDVEPFKYDLAAPLRELNTATALDVLEDVKANWEQARRDKVMLIEGKRVEIDAAAKSISSTLEDFGKSWRPTSRDDSLRNTLLKKIGSIVLDQTRMEAWCDMVDKGRVGKKTGSWMKYVFNPVKQASDKTRLSQAEYTKRLTEIIDSFQFTKETIEAPELDYTFGKDTGYGKAELIHALLHTGNMSNFQRLLVGRGWGSVLNGQVNAVKWNAFMSRMISEGRITEKDMDGVQKIWDLFEELKPQSQKAYKEVFGRYFDEITATPFFEFGKRYAGGYVPVIYDSHESSAGEKQLDPTMDLLNEMGTAFPRLQAGWGNSRKNGNFGPLLLDLSRLSDHIRRQILFSNMAPVNKDVSRLLNQKNVREVLRGYDPEFMQSVIMPWLSRAITQNLEATGKKPTPYDKIARELRMRSGAITMFGNVTNAIEQIFDMTAAYSKLEKHRLTDAFKMMVSDRSGTVKAVMDASAYMRGRMDTEIMAANGRLEQALRPSKLKKLDKWLIDHAYFLQASVDNFCAPMTWMAAYNQATAYGLSHNEAVAQADSVVRQVFGANAAEDVSNFEAGGPLKRLFSQFTGYFVQRANLIAGEYSKIQRTDIANRKAAVAILLLQTALLPAWIGAALRSFAGGSDDDETFASWLLDVFGWGTFNYGLSMGGLAGQISNAALDWYRGKSFSSGRVFYPPAIKMIEDAFKFRKWEDSSGDFDVSKFIQDMAEIERVVPGLPIIPARPVATARYIYDVATDEVEPTSGYDFVRGVVTGRASPDSKQ